MHIHTLHSILIGFLMVAGLSLMVSGTTSTLTMGQLSSQGSTLRLEAIAEPPLTDTASVGGLATEAAGRVVIGAMIFLLGFGAHALSQIHALKEVNERPVKVRVSRKRSNQNIDAPMLKRWVLWMRID